MNTVYRRDKLIISNKRVCVINSDIRAEGITIAGKAAE